VFSFLDFQPAEPRSAPLLRIVSVLVGFRRLSYRGCFLFAGNDGVAWHIDLELYGGVILDELNGTEFQMLPFVREDRWPWSTARRVSEDRNERLGFLYRIDNVEAPSAVVFVGIPEAIALYPSNAASRWCRRPVCPSFCAVQRAASS